jgi:hydroxypyruvate isomerase
MLRFAANITLLYRELPIAGRFAAARADGFDAVEILSPENATTGELASAARSAGIGVALCNAPLGDFLDGGPGLSAIPGREEDFRQAIEAARRMAVALDCRAVHIGPSRVPQGVRRRDCLDVLTANLAHAARALADDGIVATVEPLNTRDVPDVCLYTVADALKVLDDAGETSTALQFDIYHAARMEVDVAALIEKHIARIAHMQFADAPGRHEPGSGSLDFGGIFALIGALGYPGYLGAEYVPTATTALSLAWLEEYRQ